MYKITEVSKDWWQKLIQPLNSRKMATKEFSDTLNVLLSSKTVVIGNCKVVSSEKMCFVTAGFHKNQEFLIYSHS